MVINESNRVFRFSVLFLQRAQADTGIAVRLRAAPDPQHWREAAMSGHAQACLDSVVDVAPSTKICFKTLCHSFLFNYSRHQLVVPKKTE